MTKKRNSSDERNDAPREAKPADEDAIQADRLRRIAKQKAARQAPPD